MTLELRVPPPLVAGTVGLLMWLASKFLGALNFALPARGALAIALAAAGLCLGIVALLQFRKARTTHHPMKPEEASVLVIAGVYRFTRNPMYLGVLLILLAGAVWLANVAAFLLLPGFVAYLNRFQIAPEERALQARFGADYDAYRRAVRRWI
ncbi:MAG TPA: isoprenylcysteine carboxylmethyltransferase family protein [Burkholderiales bacterium]|nr:isoprenylcysteine carboxylmethyltransferase family protein [Burkholderiales bacterium]